MQDDYRHKKKKKYLSDLKKKKHRKAEKLKRLDSDRKKKRKNKETKSTKTDLIHELSQTSTFGPHPPITIDKSLPVVSITPINAHIAEPVKKCVYMNLSIVCWIMACIIIMTGGVYKIVIEYRNNNVLLGRSFAPMTKEQYDKQQSVLRRVVDPETGRTRYDECSLVSGLLVVIKQCWGGALMSV